MGTLMSSVSVANANESVTYLEQDSSHLIYNPCSLLDIRKRVQIYCKQFYYYYIITIIITTAICSVTEVAFKVFLVKNFNCVIRLRQWWIKIAYSILCCCGEQKNSVSNLLPHSQFTCTSYFCTFLGSKWKQTSKILPMCNQESIFIGN